MRAFELLDQAKVSFLLLVVYRLPFFVVLRATQCGASTLLFWNVLQAVRLGLDSCLDQRL